RERPELDATLRGTVATAGRRPAHLEGSARWRDDSLNAGLDFLQSASQRLSFRGRLPLRLDLSPTPAVSGGRAALDARPESQRFALSWFEPLFSKREVRNLRGQLDGRVDAKGDPARPGLSGSLSLTRASVELPQLGTTFEKGVADLGFEDRV